MWRVRPRGSREGPASCEGGAKPRLETAGTAVQEHQSKEKEKASWDQNRRMNKRNFTFKSTTSGGRPNYARHATGSAKTTSTIISTTVCGSRRCAAEPEPMLEL